MILGAIGLGVAGVFAGAEWLSSSPTTTTTAGWAQRTITLAQWRQTRGQHYLIGHRGSGDVRPEHTIQAYDAAMAWGANALEISTSSTSDGVLVCMHDLTYDRTTNGRGAINAQPSSVLDRIRVTQPQLGQAWMTPPLPRVPRLDDVLARYGGHAVLCIEAKRDADYAAMIALVERHGLQDSVIVTPSLCVSVKGCRTRTC